MNRIILIILFLFAQVACSDTENFEEIGDKFYNMRNVLKNDKPNVTIIEDAIQNYKKALEKNASNDVLIYKYARAIEFKYGYIIKGEHKEKKKVYQDLIELLEKNYKKTSVY